MLTKEMITRAEKEFTDLQARIFFNKLASLDVLPDTDEEAATLWQLGDRLLRERPRLSDAGRQTKQASARTFGERSSALTGDGCSLDAHRLADELCHDPNIMNAAQILLATPNAI